MITDVTGQTSVPFGDGVIALRDTVLGKVFNKILILFFFFKKIWFQAMRSVKSYGTLSRVILTWVLMVLRLSSTDQEATWS